MDRFMAEMDMLYTTPARKNLFPTVKEVDDSTHDNELPTDTLGSDSISDAATDAGTALAMQSLSPKMKLMYGKEETEYRKGYYGPLTFFNLSQTSMQSLV